MRARKQTINSETLDVSEKTKLLGAFIEIESDLKYMINNMPYLNVTGIEYNCKKIIYFIEHVIREMLIEGDEENDSNKNNR